MPNDVNITKLDISDEVRHLSATRIPGPPDSQNITKAPYNATLDAMLMIFNSPTHKISAYLGNASTQPQWIDKTTDLISQSAQPPFAVFHDHYSTPGTDHLKLVVKNSTTGDTPLWVDGQYFGSSDELRDNPHDSPRNDTYDIVIPYLWSHKPGNPSFKMMLARAGAPQNQRMDTEFNHMLHLPLDTIDFNGRTNASISPYNGFGITPSFGPEESPFPYSRLATATQFNSSVFMLYHQFNSTMFIEDAWDSVTQTWVPNNVTIRIWEEGSGGK